MAPLTLLQLLLPCHWPGITLAVATALNSSRKADQLIRNLKFSLFTKSCTFKRKRRQSLQKIFRSFTLFQHTNKVEHHCCSAGALSGSLKVISRDWDREVTETSLDQFPSPSLPVSFFSIPSSSSPHANPSALNPLALSLHAPGKCSNPTQLAVLSAGNSCSAQGSEFCQHKGCQAGKVRAPVLTVMSV